MEQKDLFQRQQELFDKRFIDEHEAQINKDRVEKEIDKIQKILNNDKDKVI